MIIPAAKTIMLLCSLIPNWAPNTTCEAYLYTCAYTRGNTVEADSEQTLRCVNQYIILNNSYRPYNAVIQCYEKIIEDADPKDPKVYVCDK